MRLDGRFGKYGGCFVPEILLPALEQLEAAFLDSEEDDAFRAELDRESADVQLISRLAAAVDNIAAAWDLGKAFAAAEQARKGGGGSAGAGGGGGGGYGYDEMVPPPHVGSDEPDTEMTFGPPQ